MSFFKLFGKKKTKDDSAMVGKKDPEMEQEEERRRLKYSLSISRSGRFKQKKKERCGVLDRPELFDTSNDPDDSPTQARRRTQRPSGNPQSAAPDQTSGAGHGRPSHMQPKQGSGSGHSQSNKQASSSSGHGRSPNNSCREINGRIMPGGIRIGQQGVAS